MARKYYNEKWFELPGGITARAMSQDTSYGFRHVVTIKRDYKEIATGKCTYYNRTWERFTYESVIRKGLENAQLQPEERAACSEWLENYEERSPFAAVAMVAAIGDIMQPDQKSKNDWKKRMMEAGLPGIDFPEDWEELSEDEKQRRIDGALKQLN